MTLRRILSIIGPLALAVSFTSGCQRGPVPDGPLSVPARNTLSILAAPPGASTPDRVQWTWSVLGERNWTAPTATDTKLALAESYPLNDVTRIHGCNTWNCDLRIERDRVKTDSVHWTLTLHGSNGMTAQSAGALPLSGRDLDAVVTNRQERNVTVDLPATVTLARLGDHDITVAVTR